MSTAYINLGSNIGDRLSTLERAVADIERVLGVTARRSAPIETAPWGYNSTHSFINLGIAVEISIEPHRLHAMLQEIQHAIDPAPHRDISGAYIDRVIDIDLIAVDDMVIDDENLTIPHPRMHLRDFVLIPLRELAPEWVHPLLGHLW